MKLYMLNQYKGTNLYDKFWEWCTLFLRNDTGNGEGLVLGSEIKLPYFKKSHMN